MEYSKESVKQLLNQVHTINESYKIVRKNTGEDFNLFQILGMETAEVKTHSKFLAELLNPKGSHLQGDIFLKLFIDYLNKINGEEENTFLLGENKIKLNSEKSKIEVEKHIGKITDNEGGRIDITIEDSENRLICIENKIYAAEQDKQLLRYKNFGDKFTECHLLFLTLNGNKCSTLNEEDGIVYAISYKKHIIEWLELCKKEAVNLPILRESIGQYINLIKKLTHQTTNKKMEKDLQKIILNNVEESRHIFQNFENAIVSKFNYLLEKLEKKIEMYLENTNWEIGNVNKIFSSKDRGMIWVKPKFFNNDWVIAIEDINPLFANHNFDHRIFIGVRSENENRDFYNLLNEDIKNENNGGWNDYIFIENFRNLEVKGDNDILLKLLSNEDFTMDFINHLYKDFTSYFNSFSEKLVQTINKNKLDLDNFEKNNFIHFENIEPLSIYNFINQRFNHTKYSTIIRKYIYNRKDAVCFVLDFKHSFAIDLIFENNILFFTFFSRNFGTNLTDYITEGFFMEDSRYRMNLKSQNLEEALFELHSQIDRFDKIFKNI